MGSLWELLLRDAQFQAIILVLRDCIQEILNDLEAVLVLLHDTQRFEIPLTREPSERRLHPLQHALHRLLHG